MMKLNNKGSILQIVLIIFIIMTFALTSCLFMMKSKTNNYQQIKVMMKQKNLEILLMRYYIDQIENDIFISDDISDDNYNISYTVDDLGNLYEVVTDIEIENIEYSFMIDIDVETLCIKKFEYREGL